MAAGIDGFSSEAREEIAREISTGSLSSYQIAQRHGITKAVVDSIGKANFGAEIYGRRESLAETSLCAQVAELLSRGTSGNEIARRLGLARSTCSRFIGKVRSGSHCRILARPLRRPGRRACPLQGRAPRRRCRRGSRARGRAPWPHQARADASASSGCARAGCR